MIFDYTYCHRHNIRASRLVLRDSCNIEIRRESWSVIISVKQLYDYICCGTKSLKGVNFHCKDLNETTINKSIMNSFYLIIIVIYQG